jgi:hypothetical protein
VFGVVLLVGGIGGFAGTIIAGPIRRHLEEQTILVVCLGAVGLACFVATAFPARIGAALLAGTIALAATVGRQAFDSITQNLAPDAEKGRAFAGFEVRFELAWVGGAICAVVFEPSLAIGLVAIGGVTLAASAVYRLGLRGLRGAQLVVPVEGWSDIDRLPWAMMALARAASAQGAERMAVVLAHEAGVLLAVRANGTAPLDGLAELERLWRLVAESGPLPEGAAGQAIGLVDDMLASVPVPPLPG